MRLFFFFLAGSVCFGQHIGFGVKGAVPLTTDIEGDATSESPRYLVGPLVEVQFPCGFGVEADALYRRFGYSSTSEFVLGTSTTRARANSWEFPILAKFHWRRPYILAGVAPRYMSGGFTDSTIQSNPLTGARSFSTFSGDDQYGTEVGFVGGGGIEFGVARIHVAPEVRYVRWKNTLYSYEGSHGYHLAIPQNEVQLLVGLTWR